MNLPTVLVRSLLTIRPSRVATVTVTTIPGLNETPRSSSGDFDTTVTVGPRPRAAGTATASAAAATASVRSAMVRGCPPDDPVNRNPNRVLTL